MILRSKLNIPVSPQRITSRPRLKRFLDENVLKYGIGLAAAPAGYGKTTLLSEWARTSTTPVAWLSIDGYEIEAKTFLRYLLAAWETIQPDIIHTPLGLLLGAQNPDIESALAAFINAANQVDKHLVFIIDDYDVIESAEIHQAFTYILDHLPQHLHFILACRSEPQLPIARYRVRRQLWEIRVDELRFSHAETSDFLTQATGLNLSPDEFSSLHERTEGWVAGLQLAALALQHNRKHLREIPVLSGRQRFIADFFKEDIFDLLPPGDKEFILKTSILDRLNGALCDAVTDRQNSQQMLEKLEQENLFIVPLDDYREWFRYHTLFRDFLRAELRERLPGAINLLHQRAANWYLEQDMPEPAIDHAAAGQDKFLVTQIFDRYLLPKLVGGEIRVIKRWIDKLPEAWQTQDPAVVFAQAGVHLASGSFDACAHYLDEVERLATANDNEANLFKARVTAMRCNIACFKNNLDQAKKLAEQALTLLPETDLDFRAGIYGALGDIYRRNGNWAAAQEAYQELLAFTDTRSFRVQSVHVYGALADLFLRKGQLQDAAGYWWKALLAIQQADDQDHFPLPLVGWVYIRLSELFYEWNNLSQAWDTLMKGLERVELGGEARALVAGYITAGKIKLAAGDALSAENYLERARTYVEHARYAPWGNRFERFQLALFLAQDKHPAAMAWFEEKTSREGDEIQPYDADLQLGLAHMLFVKGNRPALDQARVILERLLQTAQAEGRLGIQIETLALKALIQRQFGDRPGAMSSLALALRLAEPDGYIRTFVDLGLPMGRALQEASARGVLQVYVETLLSAFDLNPSSPVHAPLPEQLTHREKEVLELLAAGLTNQEIAEKLVISPETVKKHTSHIYTKLNVSNRTEASARARELNLLT